MVAFILGHHIDPESNLQTLLHGAQDLAAGYMSGKLLLKLDAVAFILGHHTAEHFAFLRDPANSRARTAFYATLARLLFMEDTPPRFKAFVAPLQQARSLSCVVCLLCMCVIWISVGFV